MKKIVGFERKCESLRKLKLELKQLKIAEKIRYVEFDINS